MDADKVIVRLFVVAALFPYVGIALGSDTQPWALIVALAGIVLLLGKMRFVGVHWGTFIMALSACLMAVEGGGFGVLRNVAGYVSLFLLSVMATHAMRVDPNGVAKTIDISLIVWLVVGFIQRIVSRDAFIFLLSDARTTETRGVVGLASEPTHFASMILLMILWRATLGLNAWHVFALLIVVVGLASSSQILLILLISAAICTLCLLFNPRYYWVALLIIGIGIVGGVSILWLLQDSRIASLAKLAWENPVLILSRDASANERFVHIFAGLSSIVDHKFLPQGMLTEPWIEYVNEIVDRYPNIFWVPQGGDRIMSAFGAVLYQLGLLGLPLIIAAVVAIYRWDKQPSFKIVWFTAYGTLLLTALPLGHPVIGAVLGALAFVGTRRGAEHPRLVGTASTTPVQRTAG